MNAERRVSLPRTDHERLELLLAALPELQMHELYERLVTVAILSDAHQDMLEEYSLTIGRSAVFSFHDEQTQKVYERFNNTAEALSEYTAAHMFPGPQGDRFVLHPDQKNGAGKQRAFWEEQFAQLETLALEFITAYRDLLRTAAKRVSGHAKERRSLKESDVKFDDNIPAIFVDDVRCDLPPFKNEHFLCRVMFARRVGEATDWSTVYEEMESRGPASQGAGKATKTAAQEEQTVKDAVHALNERLQEVTGTEEQILTWSKKTIRRNF